MENEISKFARVLCNVLYGKKYTDWLNPTVRVGEFGNQNANIVLPEQYLGENVLENSTICMGLITHSLASLSVDPKPAKEAAKAVKINEAWAQIINMMSAHINAHQRNPGWMNPLFEVKKRTAKALTQQPPPNEETRAQRALRETTVAAWGKVHVFSVPSNAGRDTTKICKFLTEALLKDWTNDDIVRKLAEDFPWLVEDDQSDQEDSGESSGNQGENGESSESEGNFAPGDVNAGQVVAANKAGEDQAESHEAYSDDSYGGMKYEEEQRFQADQKAEEIAKKFHAKIKRQKGKIKIVSPQRYNAHEMIRGNFPYSGFVKHPMGDKPAVKAVICLDASGSMRVCYDFAKQCAQAIAISVTQDGGEAVCIRFDHNAYRNLRGTPSVFDKFSEGSTSFDFLGSVWDDYPNHLVIVITDGESKVNRQQTYRNKQNTCVIGIALGDEKLRDCREWAQFVTSIESIEELPTAINAMLPVMSQ
jgi:hypothetical protein